MFRAGLYARVSTNDQQTLPMQSRALREYAARRGWTIALQVREVGSGAAKREAREKLLGAARRREIDVVQRRDDRVLGLPIDFRHEIVDRLFPHRDDVEIAGRADDDVRGQVHE